jgi:hypothetical protein
MIDRKTIEAVVQRVLLQGGDAGAIRAALQAECGIPAENISLDMCGKDMEIRQVTKEDLYKHFQEEQ